MDANMSPIIVETSVRVPIEKAWRYFTGPEHITKWNAASDDWHSPRATNDLRVGGQFTCRMEARDGSMGFDFAGTYDDVVPNQRIAYHMSDGRKVVVAFAQEGDATRVTETFDPESQHPLEMQRGGWQAILDNFKKYAEAN
jgi:uncharacterized protein YndB with AHSA1/START domain